MRIPNFRIGGRYFDTRRHLASSARGLGDRNRELRFKKRSVNSRFCFASVAADEPESPIRHRLWRIRSIALEAACVVLLTVSVLRRRKRVLSSEPIPVVNVFAQRNQFGAGYRLLVQDFEQVVCGRATGTPFRGKQFRQYKQGSRLALEAAHTSAPTHKVTTAVKSCFIDYDLHSKLARRDIQRLHSSVRMEISKSYCCVSRGPFRRDNFA